MGRRLILGALAPLAALLLFLGTIAVSPADAQTLDQLASSLGAASPLVVTGRVTAIEARWDPAVNAIYTYVTISVADRLKGQLPDSQIVIKQMGGQVGDVGLRVDDQATFTTGEDVLLFLAVRPRDGTLYPAGFDLGKWRVLRDMSTGQVRAVPPATLASGLAGPAAAAAASIGVDLATIRTLVAGTAPLSGPFVTTPNETSLASPAYALLPTGGAPARWHQVDEGDDIIVDSQVPPGGIAGGQQQLNVAMSLWSNGGTKLRLRFGASAPIGPPCSYAYFPNDFLDRHIVVYYNDPCGEVSDADPNKSGIGGGFFTAGDRRTVGGTVFDAFVQGLVVINNVGNHTATPGCFQDALTHNLGHAIGLGDTDSVGAIMQPNLSGCSAGAGLAADDVNGLRAIYPPTASGGTPPQPPTAISANAALSTVTINWTPATTGGPASNYLLEAGTAPGLANILTYTLPALPTTLVVNDVPTGTYYLRARARNMLGTSGPSPDTAVTVGVCTPPGPPSSFMSSVADQVVNLGWTPPTTGGTAQGYILAAGTAPGLQNILALPYPASVTSLGTVAPYGDYYVRVFATNVCGISAPTPDALIHVAPCTAAPGAPTGFAAVRNGNQVTFTWTAPTPGPAPSQYIFIVGSVPGGADLAVAPTGNSATSLALVGPSGVYYVRIYAANACGNSAFSNEVQVVIP